MPECGYEFYEMTSEISSGTREDEIVIHKASGEVIFFYYTNNKIKEILAISRTFLKSFEKRRLRRHTRALGMLRGIGGKAEALRKNNCKMYILKTPQYITVGDCI